MDVDEPTSFLDHENLGCTQRECKPNEIIFEDCTKMFESRISSGATEQLPGRDKPHSKTVASSYDMEGHARKCVEHSRNSVGCIVTLRRELTREPRRRGAICCCGLSRQPQARSGQTVGEVRPMSLPSSSTVVTVSAGLHWTDAKHKVPPTSFSPQTVPGFSSSTKC